MIVDLSKFVSEILLAVVDRFNMENSYGLRNSGH